MSLVANKREFSTGLEDSYNKFERKFSLKMERLLSAAMVRLLRRTPVNTGAAVMSYVATAGSPYVGAPAAGFTPVEPTNQLPLGAETLRGPAETVAMHTLAQVSFEKPFTNFWITNNSDHIAGLEYGELPGAPYVPRSPQGMFGVTLQELSLLLNGGIL